MEWICVSLKYFTYKVYLIWFNRVAESGDKFRVKLE